MRNNSFFSKIKKYFDEAFFSVLLYICLPWDGYVAPYWPMIKKVLKRVFENAALIYIGWMGHILYAYIIYR